MENVLNKYNNFSKEYFVKRIKNEMYYDELFQRADEYLGTIIKHCQNIGLTDDSLIVVISDHGISVGEKVGERAYGVFCYDYTVIASALFHYKGVPLISYEQQVRSIDILPTILEILSINSL